jgi:HEPN domain-containing protein
MRWSLRYDDPVEKMGKNSGEWLKQAEYDLGTAEAMLQTGRLIYAVFMCHLAVEKTLKAIWVNKLSQTPGKTHDLIFLSEKLGLDLPSELADFLEELNDVSVPTRYPDELDRVLREFTPERTKAILHLTQDMIKWLRK